MSDPQAVKISSDVLGVDIWIAFDKAFSADDGLAVYYVDEMPLLRGKDPMEMRAIQMSKLAFPGSRVIDREFEKVPPLPFTIRFSEKEIADMKEWWKKKYPKGAGNYFDYKNPWIALPGEETFELFTKSWGIPYTRHSRNVGSDPMDYEIGSWKIDVKTRAGVGPPFEYYRHHVNQDQHYDRKKPTNVYQFAYYNMTTRECTLCGWLTRKEFDRIGVRRKKGERDGPVTIRHPQIDVAGSETTSEMRYVWDYPGRE